MMLGDILAMARGSAAGMARWLEATNPEMHEHVSGVADRMGVTMAMFIRRAVADFARAASEDDWATLMSALRESSDPGRTCLHAMLHWRLAAPDCGAHA